MDGVEVFVTERSNNQELRRLGASDARIVVGVSGAGQKGMRGGIVLQDGPEGASRWCATLYDAARHALLQQTRERASKVGADGHRALMDSCVELFRKAAIVGARRPFFGPKTSPTTTPLRIVSGGSASGSPRDLYALEEGARARALRASVPWASPTTLALLGEIVRSSRILSACDSAIDTLRAEQFTKGFRVTDQRKRRIATGLTLLRADVATLDAHPFLSFATHLEEPFATAASAVLANRPIDVLRLCDMMRAPLALQQARMIVESERMRFALLDALRPAPSAGDHDGLLAVKRAVDIILTSGGVPVPRRESVAARFEQASRLAKFLDYPNALMRLSAIATLLD